MPRGDRDASQAEVRRRAPAWSASARAAAMAAGATSCAAAVASGCLGPVRTVRGSSPGHRKPHPAGAADRGIAGIGGAEALVQRAGNFRKRHPLVETLAQRIECASSHPDCIPVSLKFHVVFPLFRIFRNKSSLISDNRNCYGCHIGMERTGEAAMLDVKMIERGLSKPGKTKGGSGGRHGRACRRGVGDSRRGAADQGFRASADHRLSRAQRGADHGAGRRRRVDHAGI